MEAHTLSVVVKIYGSGVTLKPQVVSFRVVEYDGRKLIEAFLIPLKIFKNLLPFRFFIY